MKILIAGGPKTGKTTDYPDAKHTDDLIELGWSEASYQVATDWMKHDGDWTIEGIAVPRALRKWLDANEGQPCDKVIYYNFSKVPLTKDQKALAKGCKTVWEQIKPELYKRGVRVEER